MKFIVKCLKKKYSINFSYLQSSSYIIYYIYILYIYSYTWSTYFKRKASPNLSKPEGKKMDNLVATLHLYKISSSYFKISISLHQQKND